MDEKWPTVSIIVPAYNAERTIEKCLESITRLHYPGKYEVILVNNRSTDNTVTLAKKFNVRIVDALKLQSACHARNVGLANSQAQVVVFTDSDCIANKKWIYYLVQPLMQDSQIAGVGGEVSNIANNMMETIFADFVGKWHDLEGRWAKPFLLANPSYTQQFLVTANAAYKRRVLEEIGFFDESFSGAGGGDVDLTWRVAKRGYKIVYEPRAVVYHRARNNPYSFFKQYYRYGFGQAKLFSKHKIKVRKIKDMIRQRIANGSLINPRTAHEKVIMARIMTRVSRVILVFGLSFGFIKGKKSLNQTTYLKKR